LPFAEEKSNFLDFLLLEVEGNVRDTELQAGLRTVCLFGFRSHVARSVVEGVFMKFGLQFVARNSSAAGFRRDI
jgi:hypothetical protein